ncbi:MAG: glycosyltransferase family 9 protein [Gammaproteobacteria bacterium]|nr:glycosyltransferase family 9 protein [Gammaproteobacteria bacterium]MBV9621468.1 glycosyltransferase family 9 protein [Gammaproteobacteria bacterium]
MLPLAEAPQSVCILRLSAIGDTCHVVPLVRSLQQAWPTTRLTWIIGRSEARLMSLIEGVEFITLDKRSTGSGLRRLRRALRTRRFDVLLHLQVALRASLAAACVPARIRLGFDRARARELQWLFTNARVAPRAREHVLDSFLGFAAALGVPTGTPRWELPLPDAARDYALRLIPDDQPTLLISPCSSHPRRNWLPERYAAVAAHAHRQHGLRVILCGGPSPQEQRFGAQISAACDAPLINQIGRDTLPELLALLARARVLLAPDSGPAHMATMVGTPVLGLYAATNPARSGPYRSRQWCIDQYPVAARIYRGVEPQELPWGHKIEDDGVMKLISVEEVNAALDRLLGARA